MFGRVSRVGAAVGAAAALTLGLPAVAHADRTVVVHGTDFPDMWAQLAYVGCDDLFVRDDQTLAPTIGLGPNKAPSGARSLGYDLAGGTAIGSQHLVTSVVGNNTATLSVFAPSGTTGRAVVGYQAPVDSGTAVMWFGVAAISAPAGQWTTVAATPRSYAWTKYDMSTRAVLESTPGEVPVGEFVTGHGGDGPGLYALTFGCDGAPFSMDAMRIGRPGAVTTYDLEGLDTWLSIDASDRIVKPGQPVTLRGDLHTSNGHPIDHATVILERHDPLTGRWENIRVVDVGARGPVAQIEPTRTAYYRWRFVDRPLAEGATSAPFVVAVLDAGDPTPTDPTPTPTPTPDPTTPEPTTPTPTLPTPSDPTPTSTPEQPPASEESSTPATAESEQPTEPPASPASADASATS